MVIEDRRGGNGEGKLPPVANAYSLLAEICRESQQNPKLEYLASTGI